MYLLKRYAIREARKNKTVQAKNHRKRWAKRMVWLEQWMTPSKSTEKW
jgi:hypothetical protein